MANLPVYSAREVNVTWGAVNMEGFSGDNMVSFAYNSDLTTETVSCDGKLATSVTPDRTGTVTVELMQTSQTTRDLSAILAYQEAQGDTSQIFKVDFLVSDPSGSVICLARQAYLKTAPEVSLGVEQNTHEWVFYCENISFLGVPQGTTEAAATVGVLAAQMALSGLPSVPNLKVPSF